MRRKVHLSALAESDLIDICHYSFERSGASPADKYLDDLDHGIVLLAENAELGATRDDVREGYRVIFINRHAIYYTIASSTIHIVRVLHAQMDPDRHL